MSGGPPARTLQAQAARSSPANCANRLLVAFFLCLLLNAAALATPLPIPRSGVPLDTGAGPSVPLDEGPTANPAHDPITALLPAEHLSPADILRRSSHAIVTIMSVLPREGSVRGTGFFADARGLVVTSHHLIDDASSIKVKTRDGKVFEKVKVIAARPNADLAVLEISDLKQSEPFLRLGDSELVRVGEPVVAIGHPLGLEYTLSNGLVSALRAAEIHGLDLIQFSAPVSPGCSGGPILNSAGQVIGIVCLSHPEGQNLNFAIPINYLREVLVQLDHGNAVSASLHDAGETGAAPAMVRTNDTPAQALSIPAGVDLVPQTPSISIGAPIARRVFRSGQRGFAVDCPSSWTCHSNRDDDSVTVQMESADGLIRLDFVSVGLQPGTDLHTFATRAVRSLNATILSTDLEASAGAVSGPRRPRLVRESKQSVNGVDWQMYVHRYTDADGNDQYAVTMLSVSDSQGYMVHYTAPVGAWSRLRPSIERVVASAQIF